MGKYFINSPVTPGQKSNGTNAAKVVAVDDIIGIAISLTPLFTASSLFMPCSCKRYTFSTTTMALSTNMPKASSNPNSIIVLMV